MREEKKRNNNNNNTLKSAGRFTAKYKRNCISIYEHFKRAHRDKQNMFQVTDVRDKRTTVARQTFCPV